MPVAADPGPLGSGVLDGMGCGWDASAYFVAWDQGDRGLHDGATVERLDHLNLTNRPRMPVGDPAPELSSLSLPPHWGGIE